MIPRTLRLLVALALLVGFIVLRQLYAVGRRPAAEAAVRDLDAAQRADGDPLRGPFDADRAPAALVSRRLEEREAGADRVRAPLRAPDVQGLEERRARRAHVDDFVGRRPEQRLHDDDETVFWETVPAQYLPLALWLEADRMATLRIDRDTLRQRARGGEGRAADARRQPAVRPAERDHLRPGVHDASVQASDDRQHGGPRSGVGRGRARLLPDLLRAGERDAGARRRFRHGAGEAAGRRSISAACRRPSGRCRATSRRSRRRPRSGASRSRRRGRCPPSSSRITSPTTAIPIPIRCTSRRKCCPTARARASIRSWSTRSSSPWRRSAART